MKTYLYRASNLKSTITFWPQFRGGSQFLVPAKTVVSCDLFIINHHTLLQTGFLRVY